MQNTLTHLLEQAAQYSTSYKNFTPLHPMIELSIIIISLTFIISKLTRYYVMPGTSTVYLVDFKAFQAPDSWKCSTERYFITGDHFKFSPELQEFQMKMLRNSGLGEGTSFPPGRLIILFYYLFLLNF